MKIAKPMGFLTAGILAFVLAGCFNPITMTLPKTAETPVVEPFSVDIFIGEDTGTRSVAGPDANRIKEDIRNIIQLVVMDDSGKIAAFDEVRRGSDDEKWAVLRIDTLPFGKNYHFLLLMGHWERNYAEENNSGAYVYTTDRPPTLLAAGLKEQVVSGSGKVTVTMWPVVVDTVFTSSAGTIAPVVNEGKPEEVSLLPVGWDVTWTIQPGLSDLVKAQKVPNSGAGEVLRLKSAQTLVKTGTDVWSNVNLYGNIITQGIGTYTSGFGKIGTSGSVNFKLEYIPYNLSGSGETNPWTAVDGSSVFNLGENREPVWIIRNGVNDTAQDGDTDFTLFHKKGGPGIGTANGNGSVRFRVAAKTPGGGSTLVVKDGVFVGPASSTTPDIKFTTDGYDGQAEAYYAVVPAGDGPPKNSAYKLVDTVAKGIHQETIEVPAPNGNYDVYVIIFKDGAVSDPLIINTGSGGVIVVPVWGEDPYMSLYVKSNGNDGDTGDRDHPLATVQEALARLASAYASDASWPERGTAEASPGAIIVMDTVNVAARININSSAGYPPIVLCDDDDPGASEGKLQITSAVGPNTGLLNLSGVVKVTLAGGLTLAGTWNKVDNIAGVYVTDDSTFIMNGGKISGTWVQYGGGVYMHGGTFIMNSGEISGNLAEMFGGGGVYVCDDGTFTMNGGLISKNTGANGGGVNVDNGTFIMNGGVISLNIAASSGGGVVISKTGGTFNMDAGEISGNTAYEGGGVFVDSSSSTFNMSGGEIYANSATNYRGVCVAGGTFNMSGGEIHSHTGNSSYGSGVYVTSSGTFTMHNGKIHDNSANYGGGVCVNDSIFTMYGGEISDNSAAKNGGGAALYVSTSSMEGGIISNNTADPAGGYAGGVYVSGGTFTVSKSGKISGNSAGSHGAGVAAMFDATFIMNGGEISGNYGPAYGGGGVHLQNNVTFNMTWGKIFGNSAGYGGGVDTGSGCTFVMTGGEIYGNSARNFGGGVNMSGGASFAKNGGTIYGYNTAAPNAPYDNKVVDSSGTTLSNKGHAAYVSVNGYFKDTTVTGSLFLNDSVNNTSGWDW